MTRKTRQRIRQPRKQRLFAHGPQRITLTSQIADLQLTAADPSAEGQRPKVRAFSMTAYTGGQMTVAGYYWPVVVDLAGMTVRSQTRPILYSHDAAQIVGHSEKISVTAQTIKVSGKVSGISAAASEVTALGDNGFPWQASIGAEVQQLEFVDRGNTVKVNGRNVSGPVYVARRTSLREISFAALGADDNTTASIAASLSPQEHRSMEFSQWLSANGFDAQSLTGTQLDILQSAFEATGADLPDNDSDDSDEEPTKSAKPVAAAVDTESIQKQVREIQAAEADRTSSIKLVCAKYGISSARIDGKEVTSLEAHAIREGWSAEKTELEALRASRPKVPAIHVAEDFSSNLGVLECAVARTARLPNREKSFDEKTLEAADRQYKSGVGLQRLLIMAASASGFNVQQGPLTNVTRDFLRAAFSMHEVINILSNTGNKMLLESFNAVESVWRNIGTVNSVNDFKTKTSYRLVDDAKFDKVGPDGRLRHALFEEESFTNRAETYGKILQLNRQDIINDDLGALTSRAQKIGRGAALRLNEVFWLEFNTNSTFFTTARKNYFEGAATNLQFSSLQTAEQMFMDQTDPKGNPLAVMPSMLLVPTSLAVTAKELFASQNIVTGSTGKNMATNVFAGMYRPEVSAYVGNTAFGGTQTSWYLLANPNDLPTIEVVFLNGQQTPIIEEAEADFDMLGIAMRGYFDFGVAKQDWRGGVRSKGAA
jgi:hypothetical protein